MTNEQLEFISTMLAIAKQTLKSQTLNNQDIWDKDDEKMYRIIMLNLFKAGAFSK